MDLKVIAANRLDLLDCNSERLDCMMDLLEGKKGMMVNRMGFGVNILMNILAMVLELNNQGMMANILVRRASNPVMMVNNQG